MTTPSVSQCKLTSSQLSSTISAQLFSSTQSASNIKQAFVGHERAKEALEFGLSMSAIGFNVFAMGEHGTGRQTLIKQMLTALAKEQPTPAEWCYINNFDENHAPFKLYVNPGDGKQLLSRMNKFIDELMDLFPEIFDNPGYQRQKSAIDREFNKQYDQAIAAVEDIALKNNVALYEENGEVGFSPLVDGKPLNDKEFANIEESERAKFYQLLAELENVLAEQLLELPLWKRISSDKMRKLKYDTAEQS
ncbi:MAG: AAA family ATPase, partial [Colwellia sp.]|nr:AAA family ATPase [Colwellia sp.]